MFTAIYLFGALVMFIHIMLMEKQPNDPKGTARFVAAIFSAIFWLPMVVLNLIYKLKR